MCVRVLTMTPGHLPRFAPAQFHVCLFCQLRYNGHIYLQLYMLSSSIDFVKSER